MKIETRTKGDVTVLLLKGKMLGGKDDELLRDTIDDLIDEGRIHIVLDLTDVPYMDSACLGEIVRSHTTVRRENGTLKLVNLSEKLRQLLSRTRLDWVGGEESDDETS